LDFCAQIYQLSHKCQGAAVSFFDYPGEPAAAAAGGGDARLLGEATDEEWAALLKHTQYHRISPGETVIEYGAAEQSLHLVIEGELEVLVPHGRRGWRRIAVARAGSVIGELSFFDGGIRSASVRAVTPSLLAELTPADFNALSAANPSLAWRLLFDLGRILAERLRAATSASSVSRRS
jgi:CRP-like cAMP-binding protein